MTCVSLADKMQADLSEQYPHTFGYSATDMPSKYEQLRKIGLDFAKKIPSLAASELVPIPGAKVVAAAGVSGIEALHVALKDVPEELATDWLARQLSLPEQLRVGGGFYLALNRVNARLLNGDQPNGLFSVHHSGSRMPAEELCESMLNKCRATYQERKIPFLATAFAESVFNQTTSPSTINEYLDLIDDLTYRQLCIVAAVGKDYKFKAFDLNEDASEESVELLSVFREAYLLVEADVVRIRFNDGDGEQTMTDLTWIDPSRMTLPSRGQFLFQLSGLCELPDQDIHEELSLIVETDTAE